MPLFRSPILSMGTFSSPTVIICYRYPPFDDRFPLSLRSWLPEKIILNHCITLINLFTVCMQIFSSKFKFLHTHHGLERQPLESHRLETVALQQIESSLHPDISPCLHPDTNRACVIFSRSYVWHQVLQVSDNTILLNAIRIQQQ